MKRPSFQFYPADWRGNIKLRRCSEAARGAWMDVLCALHDSDEYGLVRWPLTELAYVAGIQIKHLKELTAKTVLKGADSGKVTFVFTPRHGGKDGEPVTLIETQGPCWFSSRMVTDEYVRGRRGGQTRFTSDDQPARLGGINCEPKPQPMVSFGTGSGDGPTSSSPSPSAKEEEDSRPASAPSVAEEPKVDLGPDFEIFFDAFPKHEQRVEASRQYLRAVEGGRATAAELLAGARRYAAYVKKTGEELKFVRLAKNWLKEEGWTDRYDQLPVPTGDVVVHPSWGDRATKWRDTFGEAQFNVWFAEAEFVEADPPIIRFPKPFQRQWVAGHFASQLKRLVGGEIQLEVAA